jgi:hypothetical protein
MWNKKMKVVVSKIKHRPGNLCSYKSFSLKSVDSLDVLPSSFPLVLFNVRGLRGNMMEVAVTFSSFGEVTLVCLLKPCDCP